MKKIRPGKVENESDVVRSLRARGFYSSGIPRTGCDVPRPRRLSKEGFERLAYLKNLTSVEFENLCERSKKS